jgi:hypothetical protein
MLIPISTVILAALVCDRPYILRELSAIRRDLHILGLHPVLWAAHQRSFDRLADHGEEVDGREAESY